MKERVSAEQHFSTKAEKYRDEPLFAMGDDLALMVKSVPLTGSEQTLDIGSGAGHTALAMAPHVAHAYGLDVTEQMVQVATQLASDRGIENVTFQVGDAEQIPFPDETFAVITCRLAAHHFVQIEQAMKEIQRVLRPGGSFLLIDHYAPDKRELDQFINLLDKRRDPSHVREYTLPEWRQLFETNGLTWQIVDQWMLPLHFANWVERASTPPAIRQQLVQQLQTATDECRETFRIEIDESGRPRSFCLLAALLKGVK